ncbi:DUF6053 domain-containing protein [Lysobacter enzymogenes]|uniref:DUF6053 domain-containing protein n=1 Tax=Lysobacter enzymogenes TaxID=69 RepID=UPI003D2F6EE1
MPGSARAHSRDGRRERSGAWAYRAATWNKSVGPEGPPTARRKHRGMKPTHASKALEAQAILVHRKHRGVSLPAALRAPRLKGGPLRRKHRD